MANLSSVIKLTKAQYNTLKGGGSVGNYTWDDNALYLVDDDTQYVSSNISINGKKLTNNIILTGDDIKMSLTNNSNISSLDTKCNYTVYTRTATTLLSIPSNVDSESTTSVKLPVAAQDGDIVKVYTRAGGTAYYQYRATCLEGKMVVVGSSAMIAGPAITTSGDAIFSAHIETVISGGTTTSSVTVRVKRESANTDAPAGVNSMEVYKTEVIRYNTPH